ncbi:basic amino acid ABC transporter substrate-binding protein [Natrinema altunense]|uniref:ABC transporter periplasmic protein family 3 n=1 Tax=Natrinema altunense (strain JCM 12890 / CGMCC 1.3731 / AJ2) TaxID=1227494 RepID=L9ZG82_NATA2|nr:basic amino acid ABC transporter substrate-binding protein [Natrinema altunense]ELY85036.1 ABC transporter periplasmic protein family 3 [Natrinema altunense JCM 12890]
MENMERTDETDALDRRQYLKLSGTAGIAVTGLAGCLESSGSDSPDPDDENVIVPGTAAGFPPFEMKRGSDLVGFDIDLLEAVVGETEYELAEWKDQGFDGLPPALKDGKIDVIAAAMTINEQRQESFDFTDPYHSADQAILVQSGGDLQPESLEDLEGTTVGAQSGTTGEVLVKDDLIGAGLIAESDFNSYDNYVLATEELESGTIDAVVLDDPVAKTFASERDVEVAFIEETGEEFGFAVRPDDDDLLEALNEGLAAVRESGEYDEISEEWFSG